MFTEGAPPLVSVGDLFESRVALRDAGVHSPLQQGIQGQQDFGCQSIVLNGGYETDDDQWLTVRYTGTGGQENRQQIRDQELSHKNNRALLRSIERANPIRVTRGPRSDPRFRPPSGKYRYDGLYRATDVDESVDSRGFRVYLFTLIRLSEQTSPKAGPARLSTMVEKLVRSASLARQVKEIHDFQCQVCAIRLTNGKRNIAEAAHINPLGMGGEDSLDNLLCLCPNHHALFDAGGLFVLEDWSIVDQDSVKVGELTRRPGHTINQEALRRHREIFGPEREELRRQAHDFWIGLQ